jgi:hypothetical protein
MITVNPDTTLPTAEEARKRYQKITAEKYDPPLTEAELAYIRDACEKGNSIFTRCTWQVSHSHYTDPVPRETSKPL